MNDNFLFMKKEVLYYTSKLQISLVQEWKMKVHIQSIWYDWTH